MKKLSGVVVPAVTPLRPDGSLDRTGLERLIEFLLSQGIHGVFANGSMGGFAFLTDELQLRMIEAACEIVNRRVPVLAGASETSVERVTEKLGRFRDSPIDAFVILTPYYYLMNQEEIKRFFLKVADAADKPILLYDNPKATGNPLDVSTIVELSRHPNICGLKCSVPDVLKWQELVRADLPRDRFALFAGVEKMMGLPIQIGFDGITGGLHNLVPNLAVAVFDAAKRGDAAAADNIQQRINRVHSVFELDGGWRGAETALRWMGICEKITSRTHEAILPQEMVERIELILETEGVLRPNRSEQAVTVS